MESETIKTIVPYECPHCNKTVVIEFTTTSPKIASVYKIEDIQSAKIDAIERIKSLAVDEEKKENVIKWIQSEDTVFGQSEVESIVNSLLNPEE